MPTLNRQQGGSAIGLMIFLGIIAYGIFVGIQYVPQYIESSTVKTVLDTVVDQNSKERLGDTSAVQAAIDKQLYINEMSDLKSSFKVTQSRGNFVITLQYERELDLLYTKKRMSYGKTITLE